MLFTNIGKVIFCIVLSIYLSIHPEAWIYLHPILLQSIHNKHICSWHNVYSVLPVNLSAPAIGYIKIKRLHKVHGVCTYSSILWNPSDVACVYLHRPKIWGEVTLGFQLTWVAQLVCFGTGDRSGPHQATGSRVISPVLLTLPFSGCFILTTRSRQSVFIDAVVSGGRSGHDSNRKRYVGNHVSSVCELYK